ncbi:AraC family transcriptional regulator [Sulfurimonas sp.]|uniref:helix-turn-helix transcriptional regulator n=1 Tax=Sulfurimonas sp. TaxID=2022749 RepID=UPI002B4AACFE|nr:AraC family transcriptional regulator [Sulfurimonas sp.]
MVNEYKINSHITLHKVDEFFNQDSSNFRKSNINGLILYINLEKDMENEYTSLLDNYSIKTEKKHTIIDLINKDEGISKIKRNTHKQFLQLVISKQFLEENLPENRHTEKYINFFQSNKNIENISYKKTNQKTQLIAHEIFNNTYKDKLEKMFIESKVLELLYTEFTDLFKENEVKINKTIKLSSADKDAIYRAKNILINNLSNPPSIKELARKVAINDLKLKIGFHKFFNETPYSISLEYRLQESKLLLEKSELNITEISQKIGYKYASNFSNAFFNRFGLRPKDIMKTRKYYF